MEEYVEGIPLDKRNITVSSPDEIAIIAEKIQRWEPLASFLGLPEPKVEEIKKDYQHYDEQK